MAKKTILMILPEFGYGGAEKSFCALSVTLGREYIVKVVVFSHTFKPRYPIGGEIISLDNRVAKNWLAKFFKLVLRVRKLRKLKNELDLEASISFLEGANYVNILSSAKEKTIISIRGSKKFDQNINSSYSFLRKKILTPILYSRADSIVALSHGIKQELVSTYASLLPENIEVIYNYVDFDKIFKLAQERLTDEWEDYFQRNTILVIASRLAEEKGIQSFLPVFRMLLEFKPHLKLLIIGDGHYIAVLKEVCNNLDIVCHQNPNGNPTNAAIQFLGFQANPFKWIKKSSVFISASIHEGFGNSILEALACGIPVIASDCPYGPREIIANRTFKEVMNYPYYVDSSILLPTIGQNTDASNLWVQTLLDKLSTKEKTESFRIKKSVSLDRFKKETYINKWRNIIENS